MPSLESAREETTPATPVAVGLPATTATGVAGLVSSQEDSSEGILDEGEEPDKSAVADPTEQPTGS